MNKYLKTFISISLTFSVIACKTESQNEKFETDLQTYFTANLTDSTSTLDSFFVVKVDTISQRMLLEAQSSVLNNQLEFLIDLYKLNTEILSKSVDQIRLYKMIGSQGLVDIEIKDFKKQEEKTALIKSEIDSVMEIINGIDSIANTADTIKTVGFQAKCLYQIRLTDKSVKRDTVFITLNKNKDIVKTRDFLNLPYSIDYNKFE